MKRKTIRNCSYLMLCILLGYSYFLSKKDADIQKEVSIVDYQDYRQVVYMDEDHVLVPVSYVLEEFPTIQSEAFELFSLMKNPGELSEYLGSVIPENMQLESVIFNDRILQLHLYHLNVQDELRFLEAITYVFCQLEGIEGLELYLGDTKMTKFPEGTIMFENQLNDQLGINNFESTTTHLYQTKPVTVYYSKMIKNQELYVPVSKRVYSSYSLQEILETIVSEISVSSTLKKVSLMENVQVLDGSYLEDGHLYVNMNEAVLFDETTINTDIYDLLLLSFSQIEDVSEVTILVNGEIIETRDVISVSSLVYNTVKI